MNNESLIVANWKMNFSHEEALLFVTQHYNNLCMLASTEKTKLILCPSFTALYPLYNVLKDTAIKLGAQDCSNHAKGPFTGQISAQCLKSLGCSYCVVGHSDRRKYNGETSHVVAQKASLLFTQGITPIICIGENSQEFEQGKTLAILEQQLAPVVNAFSGQSIPSAHAPIAIAYEPVWAIGTGKVPSYQHLEVVFSWLYTYIQKTSCPGIWKFLYGGSVTGKTAPEIKKVSHVKGLLIGQASLDFQELKKIVE